MTYVGVVMAKRSRLWIVDMNTTLNTKKRAGLIFALKISLELTISHGKSNSVRDLFYHR
jgi:hypothetical protein